VIGKLMIGLVVIVMLFSATAAGWFYWQLDQQVQPQSAVEIVVPAGAGAAHIARQLAAQHVIDSPLAFRLWLKWNDAERTLKSGLYRFDKPESIEGVIHRLQQSDVVQFSVTVPEGLRTDEMLILLAAQTGVDVEQWQQALKQLIKGESEGRLLPETWQYTKPIEPLRILRTMMTAQQKLLDSLTTDAVEQKRLRIMASIIEKETALDRERPLVSAAIANRLRKGMPLQMDPTVIYGIYRTKGSFSGNIHRKDLRADTPWNSYTRKGLPPTPISNPGKASLRAAAAPAAVDYLFFVADGTGGHAFAATLAEHDRNVRQWVKIERSRQHGK